MYKSFISLLLCAVACANSTEIARTYSSGWFYPAAAPTPRALSGVTDCGVSEVVDIRLAGCSSAPCQVRVGTAYTLEIDFRPRDFHWDLTMRAIILKDTQLGVLGEGPIPDSTVNPGQTYTFRLPFQIPSGFNGESELRVKAFQNYVHEICMVIPFNVVK